MAFNGPINISEQDIRTTQAATQPSGAVWSPSIRLGQTGTTWLNQTYVYGLANSSTALVAGYTVQATATVANHLKQTNATAEPIGSYTVVMPLGATLATVNQYAQGTLVVVSGTGAGYQYRIKSNTAAALSTSTTLTLYDPLLVALDTTSVLSIYPNRWNGVVVTPTSTPTNVVGVSDVAFPVSTYGWFQIQGQASVFSDTGATIAANTVVIPGTTVAGTIITVASGTLLQRLGYMVAAGTAAQAQPVILDIAI